MAKAERILGSLLSFFCFSFFMSEVIFELFGYLSCLPVFHSSVRKWHGVLWGCVGDFFASEQMLKFLKRDLCRDRNTQTCHYECISSVNSNLMLQDIRNNITDVLLSSKKGSKKS